MYRYTDFDRRFVRARALQFRDQLARHQRGELSDDDFKPLRLQNGWYIQRHAPMLRVAVPYGELSSRQLRQLARVAREYDRGLAHVTTRHNVQFNWIPLERAADEEIDPRPYAEILRQWSTLHPEFAFLPRKFKIAISGAREDRAALAWHDLGLRLHRNPGGEVGFEVLAGGGMGRTPLIAASIAAFVPWQQILLFLEAIVRVYNRYGRRDNLYKARIKILVRAQGAQFTQAVQQEFAALLREESRGGAPHLIPQSAFDRVAAHFVDPAPAHARPHDPAVHGADAPRAYLRWLERNVQAHRVDGYRAVTLSLKRAGMAPGDLTAVQMDRAAQLADDFSHGELRVTHDQNLLLPWVAQVDLPALWRAARQAGFATPNIGLLSDMIACPGGDYCALAHARSIPVAAAIAERFADLDSLYDIGDIDLHLSGCMNSCGHHHSGHIGILGVDKDGTEWYQITVGGSDGSTAGGPAKPGRVIGPAFAADEVPDAIEALVETYRAQRQRGERFVDTARRIGVEPFRHAADAVRTQTRAPALAA